MRGLGSTVSMSRALLALMLLVVLAAAGCVTCHCQPVVHGDCTCVEPLNGTKK